MGCGPRREKAGPSVNFQSRLPEPRAPGPGPHRGPSSLGPRGRCSARYSKHRPGEAPGRLGARSVQQGRRVGRGAAQGAAGPRGAATLFLFFLLEISASEAPGSPWRPPSHSQFLNQHHLPGTPSQLPPLPLPLPPPPPPPPPLLPPLTAPARSGPSAPPRR